MTTLQRFIARNRNIVFAYVMMLVLLTIASLVRPGFGFGNVLHLRALLLETAVIGLVALGQTLVIISGGADLSVPWTLTGAAVLMTMVTQGRNDNLAAGILLGLGAAGIVGLVNGIGVAYLRISPIVMTLATNNILLGVVAGMGLGGVGTMGLNGQPPPFILSLGTDRVFEIPYLILILMIISALITVLLSRTSFGRYLYSIGTNETVAEYSGVNVRRVKLGLWVLAGLLNGLAGILLAGKFGRAYLGMGDPYLFISVTAVVVGGASILGGTGHYLGTIAGAMFLAVLTSLMPALNLPEGVQFVVYGVVILLAVFFATSDVARRFAVFGRRKAARAAD